VIDAVEYRLLQGVYYDSPLFKGNILQLSNLELSIKILPTEQSFPNYSRKNNFIQQVIHI